MNLYLISVTIHVVVSRQISNGVMMKVTTFVVDFHLLLLQEQDGAQKQLIWQATSLIEQACHKNLYPPAEEGAIINV